MMTEIAQRLKQAREQAGLSISQAGVLYARAKDDTTKETAIAFKNWVSKIEEGAVKPTPKHIDTLAQIYGVDPHWVQTGETSLDVAELEKNLQSSNMLQEDKDRIIRLLSSLVREE